MSKRQILIILGVLTMIIPYLGFPETGDKILSIIVGILVIFVAYRLKPESSARDNYQDAKPYVDNRSNE